MLGYHPPLIKCRYSFPVFGLPIITDNSPDYANTGDSFIVNVTVTDEDPIVEVWVEYWFDPASKTNVSMLYDGGNFWVYDAINIPLDSDDDLNYTISAKNDTGFWNNSLNQHVIVTDNYPPEINDVEANPQSTSQGGNVNITCQVSDNIEVDTVKVGITYPDDYFYNMTMSTNSGYYYESTYTMVGTYDYFIWAEDINGNDIISLTYQFTITATDTPVIDDNSFDTTNTLLSAVIF